MNEHVCKTIYQHRRFQAILKTFQSAINLKKKLIWYQTCSIRRPFFNTTTSAITSFETLRAHLSLWVHINTELHYFCPIEGNRISPKSGVRTTLFNLLYLKGPAEKLYLCANWSSRLHFFSSLCGAGYLYRKVLDVTPPHTFRLGAVSQVRRWFFPRGVDWKNCYCACSCNSTLQVPSFGNTEDCTRPVHFLARHLHCCRWNILCWGASLKCARQIYPPVRPLQEGTPDKLWVWGNYILPLPSIR